MVAFLWKYVRLCHHQVTGALQADVSVYYLSTWPVHPYRTATSLLIECNFTLSLHNVRSKLHRLLERIEEVSSITVRGEEALWQFWPLCEATRGFFSLERWHSCRVLRMIHVQRTRRSGKNDSVAPQFPSPTTSVWVTVICGMFPATAENNTRAIARAQTETNTRAWTHETHTHTQIFIINQSCLLHSHKTWLAIVRARQAGVFSEIIHFPFSALKAIYF